jgi:hypothetical protein
MPGSPAMLVGGRRRHRPDRALRGDLRRGGGRSGSSGPCAMAPPIGPSAKNQLTPKALPISSHFKARYKNSRAGQRVERRTRVRFTSALRGRARNRDLSQFRRKVSPFPKVCPQKRLKGVGKLPNADPRGRAPRRRVRQRRHPRPLPRAGSARPRVLGRRSRAREGVAPGRPGSGARRGTGCCRPSRPRKRFRQTSAPLVAAAHARCCAAVWVLLPRCFRAAESVMHKANSQRQPATLQVEPPRTGRRESREAGRAPEVCRPSPGAGAVPRRLMNRSRPG